MEPTPQTEKTNKANTLNGKAQLAADNAIMADVSSTVLVTLKVNDTR
jgi:hypothetical protein